MTRRCEQELCPFWTGDGCACDIVWPLAHRWTRDPDTDQLVCSRCDLRTTDYARSRADAKMCGASR